MATGKGPTRSLAASTKTAHVGPNGLQLKAAEAILSGEASAIGLNGRDVVAVRDAAPSQLQFLELAPTSSRHSLENVQPTAVIGGTTTLDAQQQAQVQALRARSKGHIPS